jgi:hypothetical protein
MLCSQLLTHLIFNSHNTTPESRFLVVKHPLGKTEISLFSSIFLQENEKPVVWDNIGGDRANYSVDNREINEY